MPYDGEIYDIMQYSQQNGVGVCPCVSKDVWKMDQRRSRKVNMSFSHSRFVVYLCIPNYTYVYLCIPMYGIFPTMVRSFISWDL